jgi:hypothetical protein
MRAGPMTPVMNLYEWLPPQGEISASFYCEGRDLRVEVQYESEDDSMPLSKTIVFSDVTSFYIAATPGVQALTIQYDQVALSGELVEFEASDAAKAWSKHLGSGRVRHFQVYFLSENRRLEVFAQRWHLS